MGKLLQWDHQKDGTWKLVIGFRCRATIWRDISQTGTGQVWSGIATDGDERETFHVRDFARAKQRAEDWLIGRRD
jgi:hypothetical protein